ncbi:hypothetical protein FWC31_03705 [Candidatus Saccharibacteria bacterium]|nr:hypothetical protein [Candidatus Saccharibacteria bacterium]
MKHRISLVVIFVTLALAVAGMMLMTNLTNPLGAGPLGILIIFALIYVCTLSLLLLLARLFEAIYRLLRSTSITVVKEDKIRHWRQRSTLIMAALSFVPIFLLSLNSIEQLGFRDIALIIVIEILLIFYIVGRT